MCLNQLYSSFPLLFFLIMDSVKTVTKLKNWKIMFSEYITKSHKADLEVMKKEEEMTLLKSSMEEWTKMASLGWNKQENNPSKTVLMHLPSFKKKTVSTCREEGYKKRAYLSPFHAISFKSRGKNCNWTATK